MNSVTSPADSGPQGMLILFHLWVLFFVCRVTFVKKIGVNIGPRKGTLLHGFDPWTRPDWLGKSEKF